jgi:hypothetical protein
MNTRKLLLKMLNDPDSELNILMENMDAEETCENLEEMTLRLTRIVGQKVLEGAIQLRADAEHKAQSPCPHCIEKQTLVRASFSPSGKAKKARGRK